MQGFGPGVALLLGWAVLAFGGVYPWGYWPIVFAAGALGLWSVIETRAWRDGTVRTACWWLGALVLAVTVQAVPLPLGLFERLNPSAAAVLTTSNVSYLIQPPATHPLSLTPERTLTMIPVTIALALLFVGLARAVPRLRLDRLVVAVTGLGVLIAVIGVVQRALNLRSPDSDTWQLVYGFWKPKGPGNVFGPFINRNHFAGWMVMALPLAIGYACALVEMTGPAGRFSLRRWLGWATTPAASRFMTMTIAVLTMATALVLTGSRSGIASFAIGLAVLSYFVARRAARRAAKGVALGYLALLLLAGLTLAGVGATAARFALVSADVGSRVGAWRDAMRIIADFPWFGAGIGAFGQAMLVYQTTGRDVFYAQAHNDYLQVAAEGGLLVGVPLAACLVALALGIRRRVADAADGVRAYWIRSGAIAGLAGIAAQSLVDFSLQIPGNTLLFVLLGAIALHAPARPADHARRTGRAVPLMRPQG